jgi:ElaB/YqjD/DUF883 family membrane-anchored ribosome-binding protein
MQTKTGNGHTVNLERFLDDLRVVVKDGQELLGTSAGLLKERAIAGAQTADRAVREHTYQTMAVAFGLGLLAGLVVTNYFRHDPESDASE